MAGAVWFGSVVGGGRIRVHSDKYEPERSHRTGWLQVA